MYAVPAAAFSFIRRVSFRVLKGANGRAPPSYVYLEHVGMRFR